MGFRGSGITALFAILLYYYYSAVWVQSTVLNKDNSVLIYNYGNNFSDIPVQDLKCLKGIFVITI